MQKIDPYEKTPLGMTSVHGASKNSSTLLLRLLLNEKSKDELAKMLALPAKFTKTDAIEHTPLSYLVQANVILPKLTEAAIENLALVIHKSDRKLNIVPREQITNPFCYLAHLCVLHKIPLPSAIVYVPKDQAARFVNGWLYSHLLIEAKTITSTLLHYAVLMGNTHIVLYCLGLGVDVNAKDSEGRTALMYAVLSAQVRMVELLLNCHHTYRHKQVVDVNACDNEGRTALMHVLEPAFIPPMRLQPLRVDLLRLLITSKANVALPDKVATTHETA